MNGCRPRIVLNRRKSPCKVSVILIDWGVRESFHSLHYLNRQTVCRDDYELIWVEFYDRQPVKLRQAVADAPLALDKWLIAGYPDDYICNKHRLYNLGLLMAEGDVYVICDSDAIFTPNFIDKLVRGFEETPAAVIHLDEVRNLNRRFYPFCYPTIEELLGPGCRNWHGTATQGLDNSPDIIHEANYGACMAAPRDELIRIGGADEHLEFLGHICGPYDMTFRLINAGLEHRWLRDEYLYHTWHPNQSGFNTDFHGPHDGALMSMRALEARVDGRVQPLLPNPWMARRSAGQPLDLPELLRLLAERPEPSWRVGCQPAEWTDAYMAVRDVHGFNVFWYRGQWYALRQGEGRFDPAQAHLYRSLLWAHSREAICQLIDRQRQQPTTLAGRIRAQPLRRLPARIFKRLQWELNRLLRTRHLHSPA